MRTLTAAGLVLAVGVGVAGCGGGPHRAAAESPKAARSTGAGAADEAAAKAVVTMAARAEAMHSVHLKSVQRRGASTVTISGLTAWGADGSGMDVTVVPAEFGLQGLNHHDHAEMRTVNGAEYIRIDPPATGPDKGKTWARWSLTAVSDKGTADAMEEGMEHSPVYRLEQMPTAGPVTLVGRETVDGQPTTHYRGTVPADPRIVAARKVPPTQQVDVWVGDDGLPVRMVSDDKAQVTTLDFTDFGGVVHIQEPPAAQTVDVSAGKTATA